MHYENFSYYTSGYKEGANIIKGGVKYDWGETEKVIALFRVGVTISLRELESKLFI